MSNTSVTQAHATQPAPSMNQITQMIINNFGWIALVILTFLLLVVVLKTKKYRAEKKHMTKRRSYRREEELSCITDRTDRRYSYRF